MTFLCFASSNFCISCSATRRIKESFSLRLRELVEERKMNDLNEHQFNKSRDMATLSYKSSMAEVERERSSMHARHYRDIVKLQKRHAPDRSHNTTRYIGPMSTTSSFTFVANV